MKKHNSFKLRAFISLYMTFASLVMVVSGVILYIAPPGRIAHWSYWSMLGFTKTEWQSLHTIFTFIFVIAGIFHIYYNWKPLVKYFSNKFSGTTSVRSELIASLIFSILIFAGTYYKIPPFSSVIDFGEEITDSWSEESNEPPIPHAEELTLSELAKEININTEAVIARLKKYGYSVQDSSVTLKDLAEANDQVPSELYNLIVGDKKNITINNVVTENSEIHATGRMGSGYGRMMISKVFEDYKLSWEEGIELLRKNGILVSEDDKLKDIASENNKLPIDIINALENK